MGEEEEEQLWECVRSDSVWERLRNQPIQSPPPSPSSVVINYSEFYFSLLPPPLTPQLHFSPPPPPPPPAESLSMPSIEYEINLEHVGLSPRHATDILLEMIEYLPTLGVDIGTDIRVNKLCGLRLDSNLYTQHTPRFIVSFDIEETRQCHSSKPLKTNFFDSLGVFRRALDVALKCFNELPWWQPLEPNIDHVSSLYEAVALAKPNDLESIPFGPFLPPKSPKMVSIWSCLSVVKISRKISIRLLQVLPSFQLPQTLQIVIVEEKMAQLPSCSGGFISQDCSLVEERSVEIMVEVDATNNGAHGVKAYENFHIVSHSEKKNMRDKSKRNYNSISVLTLEDLQQHFGSRLEDVAKSFGVSKSTMKRICRKHGISRWPFQPDRKKERSMEVISPSMHEKPDSRLQCIQTPLHARSSPRTIALLDGGEMVQLDSSKQQSLVEFDGTNNSAHLVRASQSCSTISHSDETNSRETLKRKCTTETVLSFEDLQQHFGCKRDDAAEALGVSVSTVKRTCRQHGIPRWPSRKKKKVSKMDCILLEPQGEKNVSPTCSKTPTDGQTEIGNEMVGHVQDQNEGPNLLNTENGSNEESITTPTFQDSVHDCILLESEGEKNVSPTYKTPTDGQTDTGNEMVGHLQDKYGFVPDFIEGPNLSNTENRSNEKSITTPTFQDFVPGNHPAMGLSISSTYRESGEAGNSSELAFQLKELTPLTSYPNPDARVFTQPQISSREMPIGIVGSSKDSRNLSTSIVEAFMGAHVSESSSWTVPLCSDPAPMHTITTIPHIMPHLTEKQDIRTVTFKAQYREKTIKFRVSLTSGIVDLEKEVTKRLGLELGSFEVNYRDNDNEWILIGCDEDLLECFELSSSSGNEVVRLLVLDKVANSKNSRKSCRRLKSN